MDFLNLLFIIKKTTNVINWTKLFYIYIDFKTLNLLNFMIKIDL